MAKVTRGNVRTRNNGSSTEFVEADGFINNLSILPPGATDLDQAVQLKLAKHVIAVHSDKDSLNETLIDAAIENGGELQVTLVATIKVNTSLMVDESREAQVALFADAFKKA